MCFSQCFQSANDGLERMTPGLKGTCYFGLCYSKPWKQAISSHDAFHILSYGSIPWSSWLGRGVTLAYSSTLRTNHCNVFFASRGSLEIWCLQTHIVALVLACTTIWRNTNGLREGKKSQLSILEFVWQYPSTFVCLSRSIIHHPSSCHRTLLTWGKDLLNQRLRRIMGMVSSFQGHFVGLQYLSEMSNVWTMWQIQDQI